MFHAGNSLRNAALALTVIVLSGACTTAGPPSPAPTAGPSLLGGTSWALTQLGAVPAAKGATLVFAAENVGGLAGCNTFMGSFTADSSTLVFGPLATTRKMCDPATNEFEQAYLAALAKVARYAMDGTTLTLSDTAGAALLTYTAASPADLEGTWRVTGYYNGSAHVSVIAGSTLTMVFGSDGVVSGSSGCNSYSGGYSTDGNSISIGPLRSTLMACADEALSAQETAFLEALDMAETWRVSGDQLELRGGEADLFLVSATAGANGV